jgi:hypothetical protein
VGCSRTGPGSGESGESKRSLGGGPKGPHYFEDGLEDGKVIFDYRMRPGVVAHSNALALMRAIGVDV